MKLTRFCIAKETQQNEKATYWMGKGICKVYTQIIQLRKLNRKITIKK